MKNSSWKTSAVGFFAMLILLASMALVYFEKATFAEVASGLSFVTLFISGIAAILSKDQDKTGLPK